MNNTLKIYYPKSVYGNSIEGHPEFNEDLKAVLERSGTIDVFSKKLEQRLNWLRESKERCYSRKSWFERLKHDKKRCLYSLRINDTSNTRILFIFYSDEIKPLFLCAFSESGRNTTKAYANAMAIAHSRIESLISDGFFMEEEILCHNK